MNKVLHAHAHLSNMNEVSHAPLSDMNEVSHAPLSNMNEVSHAHLSNMNNSTAWHSIVNEVLQGNKVTGHDTY